MSIILFDKSEVYQDLANGYESLKHLLMLKEDRQEEQDKSFYAALRSLYFSNVAAYLASYHTERSPLSDQEMTSIDAFESPKGRRYTQNYLALLQKMREKWDMLQYNMKTNSGDMYQPVKAYEHMQVVIEKLTDAVIERAV